MIALSNYSAQNSLTFQFAKTLYIHWCEATEPNSLIAKQSILSHVQSWIKLYWLWEIYNPSEIVTVNISEASKSQVIKLQKGRAYEEHELIGLHHSTLLQCIHKTWIKPPEYRHIVFKLCSSGLLKISSDSSWTSCMYIHFT